MGGYRANLNRLKASAKLQPVPDPPERTGVLLTCRHLTRAGVAPVAVGTQGKKWYLCPHGCGLQRKVA